MPDLYKRSVEIILENQGDSGAYLACPSFPTYMYSWLRDGSYIAYAMDLVGEVESSKRFHDWVADTINLREATVRRAIVKADAGEILGEGDYLHTRYTIKGRNSDEDWPNFQLDGYGTWLWALEEHIRLSQHAISPSQWKAAKLVIEYLSALWKIPCSDCWEEFPNHIHPHTLATIYAGIKTSKTLFGISHESLRNEILQYILKHNLENGYFVKFGGSPEVDASLIGLSVPYNLIPSNDPRMQNTIGRIESTLRNGGVNRYPTDTYYGGGEWVILAGWLGWYYAIAGERKKAMELMSWMEKQANTEGELPEQVSTNLIDATYFEPWLEKWGTIAQPLLWSHAKYIILCKTLGLET
jgi:GH15 family glucan-1,4-alpha-glucosidase